MIKEHVLRDYLDNAIKLWRKKRSEADNVEDRLIAACYIDAYQSVRVSILGELLKNEK